MSYLMFTVSFISNLFLETIFMCPRIVVIWFILAHDHGLKQIII